MKPDFFFFWFFFGFSFERIGVGLESILAKKGGGSSSREWETTKWIMNRMRGMKPFLFEFSTNLYMYKFC